MDLGPLKSHEDNAFWINSKGYNSNKIVGNHFNERPY